jgi:hypothetical protein
MARNAMNLMTGSGVQQTRTCRAEKAVEVVRNHEDGTRVGTDGAADPKETANSARNTPSPGVDARS